MSCHALPFLKVNPVNEIINFSSTPRKLAHEDSEMSDHRIHVKKSGCHNHEQSQS